MGKKADDTVLDALLNVIATATEMYLLNGEPLDRAAAIAGSVFSGGNVPTPGFGTIINGTPDGRQLPVNASNGNTSNANDGASCDHVSLCSATTQLAVTTCPAQVVNLGNTVNISAWDARVADPT